jgi:GxxExxY protein
MDKVELDAITERIIGAAHKVSNTLGAGFVEKVYENAHAHEMRKDGLIVVQQHPIKVVYDGIVVGDFFVDMLVESLVLVELKSVSALNDDHMMQTLNYLRASTLPACLLINFGTPKAQIRRLHPSPTWKNQSWKYAKQ